MSATPPLPPSAIVSWHAHLYFDAASRDAAWALRERAAAELGPRVAIGRFHERPVGPHPMWSVQLELLPDQFSFVVGWLTLNRGGIDVFVHPNTDDALADHRDRAIWLGRSHTLNLAALDR